MPRYKYMTFLSAIIVLVLMIGASTVMTRPIYQKTTERLPELIDADDIHVNPALRDIKKQLTAYIDGTKREGDEEGEMIVWNGSICASKYKTLSGSERIYYICPYIVANTPALEENESSDWTLTLQFAISALRDGELSEVDTNIQVRDIQFSYRVGENALITSVGYGDGEMIDVNGNSVSYQFRNREMADASTRIFTRLSLTAQGDMTEETAVSNWSFAVYEGSHEVALFDDVQIEIPCTIR